MRNNTPLTAALPVMGADWAAVRGRPFDADLGMGGIAALPAELLGRAPAGSAPTDPAKADSADLILSTAVPLAWRGTIRGRHA
ncbi:hypothetical protein ACFZBP_19090 [Streptomyces sp. NPDC008086]|uniref:hypothetical protein n=1 Tax=Streptomyces sp. NPDC008086 TaxID=3364807 RepID=UPI0036EA91B4